MYIPPTPIVWKMPTAIETTLLLAVPVADPLVARHRNHLDLAAQDGIPAHVTVIYPFTPLGELSATEHFLLEELFLGHPSFELTGTRTAWLGDSVMCVAVDDPEPVRRLIRSVVRSFPNSPPYAGSVRAEEVIPHLTVGQDRSREDLAAAERDVRRGLPIRQSVGHVELWAGPAVGHRLEPALWHLVRTYTLGPANQVSSGPS